MVDFPQAPQAKNLNTQNTTEALSSATNAMLDPNGQQDNLTPTHTPAPQAEQVMVATMRKVSYNPAVVEAIAQEGINQHLAPDALQQYMQKQAVNAVDNSIPFELQSPNGKLTMKGVIQLMGARQTIQEAIEQDSSQTMVAQIRQDIIDLQGQLEQYEETQADFLNQCAREYQAQIKETEEQLDIEPVEPDTLPDEQIKLETQPTLEDKLKNLAEKIMEKFGLNDQAKEAIRTELIQYLKEEAYQQLREMQKPDSTSTFDLDTLIQSGLAKANNLVYQHEQANPSNDSTPSPRPEPSADEDDLFTEFKDDFNTWMNDTNQEHLVQDQDAVLEAQDHAQHITEDKGMLAEAEGNNPDNEEAKKQEKDITQEFKNHTNSAAQQRNANMPELKPKHQGHNTNT